MSEFKIEIPAGLLESAVKEAAQREFLNALPPESRDALIVAAIKQLITPVAAKDPDFRGISSPGEKLSPVEEALRWAVRSHINKLLEEELANKDSVLRKAVDSAVIEATSRIFTDPAKREKIVDRMVDGLSTALLRSY